MHIICSDRVSRLPQTGPEFVLDAVEPPGPADHIAAVGVGGRQSYERQVYLRPSRDRPSDHLVGFWSSSSGKSIWILQVLLPYC